MGGIGLNITAGLRIASAKLRLSALQVLTQRRGKPLAAGMLDTIRLGRGCGVARHILGQVTLHCLRAKG